MRVGALLLAVALAAASPAAAAFGLGAVAVHSWLGRPLNVQIPIHLQRGERLSQLTAVLAPAAVFAKAGIPYPDYAQALALAVVRGRRGPRLLITTSRPVNDPIVQLLVQLHLGPVHLQRTVTVLLNPPARRAPAAPVRAAAVRVHRGDTLGTVAMRLRARFGRPLNPIMVALYRANPHAFIGGNMNRLKAGVWLAVPSAAAVDRIARVRAAALVRRQYAQFLAGTAPAAGVRSPPPAAPGAKAPAPTATAGAARDDGPPPPSPPRLRISSGPPAPAAIAGPLRAQLAAVQKLNQALAKQNAILRERVNLLAKQAKLLARQMETMNRLAALTPGNVTLPATTAKPDAGRAPAAGRRPQNGRRAAAVRSPAALAKPPHGGWRLWWLLPLLAAPAGIALLWRYRQRLPKRRIRFEP